MNDPPNDVVKGKRPWRIKILATLFALLLILLVSRSPALWEIRLKAKLAGADRVVITPIILGKRQPAFEIVGLNAVREFAELIDVFRVRYGERCGCRGDAKFEFLDGSTTVTILNFAHRKDLSCSDPGGRVTMKKASVVALNKWFRQQGYEEYRSELEERIFTAELAKSESRAPGVPDQCACGSNLTGNASGVCPECGIKLDEH